MSLLVLARDLKNQRSIASLPKASFCISPESYIFVYQVKKLMGNKLGNGNEKGLIIKEMWTSEKQKALLSKRSI